MTQSPKDESIEKAKEAKQNAKDQLQEMKGEHSFKMEGECLDKNGEATQVLIFRTDPPGILGLFLETGQPMAFKSDDGDVKEDTAKMQRYFAHMCNIDISKEENQEAIGWDALGEAMQIARNFFLWRLVSSITVN